MTHRTLLFNAPSTARVGWLLAWTLAGLPAAAACGDIELHSVTLSELAPAGDSVVDLNKLVGSENLDWELVSHAGDTPFRLDATSGKLQLTNPTRIDFEREPEYLLTFRGVPNEAADVSRELFAADLRQSGEFFIAEDVQASGSKRVTLRVDILDEPEPPQFVSGERTTLRLDPSNPFSTQFVSAIDFDAGDQLRYDIVAGNNEHQLTCDSKTGLLQLAVDRNHEDVEAAGRRTLQLQLRATDRHGLSATRFYDVVISGAPAGSLAWSHSAVISQSTGTSTDMQVEVANGLARKRFIAESSPIKLPASETLPIEASLAEEVDSMTRKAPPTPQTVVSANRMDPDAEQDNSAAREPIKSLNAKNVEPIQARPAGLIAPSAGRSISSRAAAANSSLLRIAISWSLYGAVLLGLAAAISIAMRGRRPISSGDTLSETSEVNEEAQLTQPVMPRTAGRVTSNSRSLRAEMADLLAVSQHFTVTQKAEHERRFHGRQFRLAAAVTVAAGGIAAGQTFLGLDRAFDPRNWVIFGCLLLITSAAIRSLMFARKATEQSRAPRPLSGEFRLDRAD